MQFKLDTEASGAKKEARWRRKVQNVKSLIKQTVTGQSQKGEKIQATNRQGERNNLRRINQSHAKGKQEATTEYKDNGGRETQWGRFKYTGQQDTGETHK